MSARPFFTCPGETWNRDPALNGCQEDSIALFKTIAENSDRDWRLEVSAVNHAFGVRRCFQDPTRFRRWSEERINRCLAELRARGCLLLATAHDRVWLEIPDRLAYCKGHKKENPLGPPVQQPLALSEEMSLFALPDIPVREEKNRKKKTESARDPAPGIVNNFSDPSLESGNQEKSLPEKTKSFSQCASALPDDPLWQRLCMTLGLAEMHRCGDLWKRRHKFHFEQLATALSDWLALRPEKQAMYANPACYITTAFENEKRRFGT